MIKLIIFDFDDTLVDSRTAHFNIDTKTAKKLKLKPLSQEKYNKYYGLPYDLFIKKLYPKVDVKKFMETNKNMYDSKNFLPFPKTIETLKYLKNKYKLAILSAKEKKKLEALMQDHDLLKFFDYLHTREDSIYHKPDGRVFEGILSHFNLKKEEVAYIGDLESDKLAAQNAGIFFVGVNMKNPEGILCCDKIEGLKKIF